MALNGFEGAANLEIFLNKLSPRFTQLFVFIGGDFNSQLVAYLGVSDVEKLELFEAVLQFLDSERKLKELDFFGPFLKSKECRCIMFQPLAHGGTLCGCDESLVGVCGCNESHCLDSPSRRLLVVG
jgi:hypothetical protein